MARRRSDDSNLDFKEQMKTPIGRWFIVPAMIAILVIGGWGLILTTFSLQNGLPQWVYGAPSGLALILYYGVEARKAWQIHFMPEFIVQKDSKGVAKQTVKDGSIVPNIQGDNLVITQTIIQNHQAPTYPRVVTPERPTPASTGVPTAPDAPTAAPANLPKKNALEPIKVARKGAPRSNLPEVIHDGEVKIRGADRKAIGFRAAKGDVLKGSIFASAPLFAWIWTEAAVARYHGTKSIGAALICNNTSAGVIDVPILETGRYFLILDTKGKQSGRTVTVRLERVVAITA